LLGWQGYGVPFAILQQKQDQPTGPGWLRLLLRLPRLAISHRQWDRPTEPSPQHFVFHAFPASPVIVACSG